MNPVVALFAPIAALLPAAAVPDGMQAMMEQAGSISDETDVAEAGLTVVPPMSLAALEADAGGREALSDNFRIPIARQVRIEQRVTIRISPRAAQVHQPSYVDTDERDGSPRFVERKMGKCLPVANIAGVQAGRDNQLTLFMRDRSIVSAALEKSCRARDYYSGFYVQRNADGMLCVDRDELQSRSGANCTVSRLRRLVPTDD